MKRGALKFMGSFLSVDSCINLFCQSKSAEQCWLIRKQVNRARGNIVQGIAILANECPESSAGASKKRVRRAMLIGSCAPCDSVPRSKLEERGWLVWHEPLNDATVWALHRTHIAKTLSFARVFATLRSGSTRNLRCALWARENFFWAERYVGCAVIRRKPFLPTSFSYERSRI